MCELSSAFLIWKAIYGKLGFNSGTATSRWQNLSLVEGWYLSHEPNFVFIIKVCESSPMTRLHSSLLNQHRPGTSDKNIAGKQIIQTFPDKTWKGKWCVCWQTAFVLRHTGDLIPPRREWSPRECCLFEILPVFIYVMHSRVLGITSSFVPFPEFPFSPPSKEFSPHAHINAVRVHISLRDGRDNLFLSLDSTQHSECLVRRSFLRPF